MIWAPPSASIEVSVSGAATGLVGTIGVRVMDGQGNTAVARSTSGIVESPAGSGIYTATITTPSTAGQYLVVWDTGTLTPTTTATDELTVTAHAPDPTVGAASVYFTVAEFRARYTDLGGKSDEQIEDARRLAEEAYEEEIGYAWVPRTATARSIGVNGTTVQLPHRFVRSVTAATDRDGNTVTISSAIYDDSSWVYMSGGWGNGHPLTVTYTHGKDAPNRVAVDAVMRLTKHFLIGGTGIIDDRATGQPQGDLGIVDFTVWPREVQKSAARQRIPSIA